jgi:probable HAF family extracellular repeat protein
MRFGADKVCAQQKRTRICAGIYSIIIAAALSSDLSGQAYQLVDLGENTYAKSLNDSGDVVGSITIGDGLRHAFLYLNGKMCDLGTLGGDQSYAQGINAAGQVVEVLQTGGPNSRQRAVVHIALYSNGRVTPIDVTGQPPDKLGIDGVYDINSSGQLVVRTKGSQAAIWSNGTVAPIGTLVQKGTGYPLGREIKSDGTSEVIKSYDEGYVFPSRINDAGEVVGIAATASGVHHAFLYSHGQIHDLGLPGWLGSEAEDINVHRQVVGRFVIKNTTVHGFLYSNGKMTDLGVPAGYQGCTAAAINAAGEIVGYAWNGSDSRAFLFRNGRWIDLSTRVKFGDSGLSQLVLATRINARGQIIAQATGSGSPHACLLTPESTDSPR